MASVHNSAGSKRHLIWDSLAAETNTDNYSSSRPQLERFRDYYSRGFIEGFKISVGSFWLFFIINEIKNKKKDVWNVIVRCGSMSRVAKDERMSF